MTNPTIDKLTAILENLVMQGLIKEIDISDFDAVSEFVLKHSEPAKKELIAWALEAVGKNDWRGCPLLKEFGHHGEDCDKPGGCIERMNRDELRAEIRAKLTGGKSD